MNFKGMSVDELMERRAAIATEIDAPEADLDALESEARAINEELETRKAEEAKRNEIREAVKNGDGEEIETLNLIEEKEEKKEAHQQHHHLPHHLRHLLPIPAGCIDPRYHSGRYLCKVSVLCR